MAAQPRTITPRNMKAEVRRHARQRWGADVTLTFGRLEHITFPTGLKGLRTYFTASNGQHFLAIYGGTLLQVLPVSRHA